MDVRLWSQILTHQLPKLFINSQWLLIIFFFKCSFSAILAEFALKQIRSVPPDIYSTTEALQGGNNRRDGVPALPMALLDRLRRRETGRRIVMLCKRRLRGWRRGSHGGGRGSCNEAQRMRKAGV